jgi:hypothetical protein
MRTLTLAAAVAAGLSFALACPAAEGEWGTVKGQITIAGKAPEPAKLDVNKDQDHCLEKGPIVSEEFVVGKDGGVKNVFVWLIDANDPKAKLPIHPDLKDLKVKAVEMDQPCCKFVPHCVALREGQVLIGKNSSPISHNMNWQGGTDNPGDNKIVPAKGQIEIKDLVASPRPIAVACNIHPWMKAWVRVFDHPYFAVTDEAGRFELKNAPAGKYNVVIWHEGVGWVNGGKTGQTIEIPAGGTVEVKEQVKPAE